MTKPSDLFIPTVAVRFCEVLPLEMLASVDSANPDRKTPKFSLGTVLESNIRRKYVYVFSSSGSTDYGIDESTPGWNSRSQTNWSLQHMAPLAMDALNPQPSSAPNPDQVDMEVYIDHEGRMWPITITDKVDSPRHKRLHPLWGKKVPTSAGEEEARIQELRAKGVVGFDWLNLPLTNTKGAVKRYYFLLSPFRIGPMGLNAALNDIGTDGLSLWFDPQDAKRNGRILGPDPEALKQCGQTVIPVVDPYNYASEIYQRLFAHAVDSYLKFVGNPSKTPFPGIDPRHFNERVNGGTIDDLYYIAGILENLRVSKVIDDKVDAEAIDEVLGGYGWELQRNAASCEVAARFLGNWMTGPAHAILDRAVIDDFDELDDPFGPDDKAGALFYWWHQLRLLPNTMTGAVFARQMLSETDGTFDNPIRALFRDLEMKGNTLDPKCNTSLAAEQLSDFIPDIVFLALMRFDPSEFVSANQLDPEKAPERAQRIANIINNLGFLDTEVMNVKEYKKRNAAKEGKETVSSRGKNIMKGGLLLADGAGKMTVRFLKRSLLQKDIGFQVEQIKKIKDYKGFQTLGKELKEMSKKSVEEMEKIEESIRKLNKGRKDLVGSFEKLRPLEQPTSIDALESRRTEFRAQIDRARAKVSADEQMVKSTKGARGTLAKTQRVRVAHIAAQTKLRQSTQQLDRMMLQLEHVENQLKEAGNVRKLTRQAEAIQELSDDARRFAQATKEDIPRATWYISLMTFGVEMLFAGSTAFNRKSSTSDIAWAFGDFSKAAVDLGKDTLKILGRSSADWAKASGGSTLLKLRSTLSLSSATGPMALLGVIAGAYNVVKYGAKGIDAFTMDDTSVGVGASLAVIGGVMGVVSALGMTALGMSASGVGVVGGLLVAAGALIISFTADDEWCYFAEHCYFAKGAGNRSKRSAGKGEDHWLGRMNQPSGGFFSDGSWSVRAQRDALVRLLSRYSVSSMCGMESARKYILPRGANEFVKVHKHVCDVEFSTTCVIDFQLLPYGATLHLAVECIHEYSNSSGQEESRVFQLFERTVKSDDMDAGAETIYREVDGERIPIARFGRFVSTERPGFVCLIIEKTLIEATTNLKVNMNTQLTLKDGTKINGSHLIGTCEMPPSEKYSAEANSETSTMDKFSGAFDRGF